MIVIDSIAVNRGGGKILLDYLINEVEKKKTNILFLLDKRIQNNHPEIFNNKYLYLKNNFIDRYLFYLKNKNKIKTIFCFANFPPPLKIKAKSYTFFHNVAYFDRENYKNSLKFFLVRLILTIHKRNTKYWIVQTKSTKNVLIKNLNIKNNIFLHPFFLLDKIKNSHIKKKKQFLYVSDGDPHKNHKNLFKAFYKLSKFNSDFELMVTVSNNYPTILNLIKEYQKKNIKIKNLGFIKKNILNSYYHSSMFFIFPSFKESFGLGLIEAANYKLPIIASNLNYVHDVIKPSLTFDPNNVDDIYKKMKLSLENDNLKQTRLIVKNEIHELLSILT